MHDFLASGEPNFTRYSLEHTYLAHLFGEKNFDNLVRKPALKRLDRRPHEIPRVWYYPPGWKINEIYDLTANMQDGTGSYDLRFGDAFYDYSWFTGFDQVETLRAVTCPSVLLHVGPDAKIGGYYDDNGVLLSAHGRQGFPARVLAPAETTPHAYRQRGQRARYSRRKTRHFHLRRGRFSRKMGVVKLLAMVCVAGLVMGVTATGAPENSPDLDRSILTISPASISQRSSHEHNQ